MIVIVEDDPIIAELLKDALNSEPEYQAAAVHDGALALETIRSVKADLIILDYQLPGIDGMQLYDLLQKEEGTRAIPVLFVTANSNHAGFKERGLNNILSKPFDLNELLSRVAEVLNEE